MRNQRTWQSRLHEHGKIADDLTGLGQVGPSALNDRPDS